MIIRLPFISFNMKFKLSTVVVQYMALVEIMTVVVNRFVSGEVGVDGGRWKQSEEICGNADTDNSQLKTYI